MSDIDAIARIVAILDEHSSSDYHYGSNWDCCAAGEGQMCCLDDTHPLGAALRAALGLPYPATRTTWHPTLGTTEHPVVAWTPPG